MGTTRKKVCHAARIFSPEVARVGACHNLDRCTKALSHRGGGACEEILVKLECREEEIGACTIEFRVQPGARNSRAAPFQVSLG